MDKSNSVRIDFIERLSGGNHELFHSNLLAFLAEHEPELFKSIFQCDDYVNAEIGREENHLDLCLYNDEGKKIFILENKMKSLPSRSQLQKYAEGNKKDTTSDCKFVLLTLVEPAWKFRETDKKWEIISYNMMIERMKDYLNKHDLTSLPYLNLFLNDYLLYVTQVDSMINDANKLLHNKEFENFTVDDYCKYGDSFNQNWGKALSKKALSQACLQYLIKEINKSDLIYQTLYNRGEAGFEVLIPIYPDKHTEENPSDMFFIHMQGKNLNRGFRIYTDQGKTVKGTKKSKIKKGLTARGVFLNSLWNENLEDDIPKIINKELKRLKIDLDSFEKTNMHAYIFDEFVMPYINSAFINENSLLIDVLKQMKNEIEVVLKICGNK